MSTVPGDTVLSRIETAMRSAVTGRARSLDGDIDYAWDLGADRVLLRDRSSGRETRQIGKRAFTRATTDGVWTRVQGSDPITPLDELRYFSHREVEQHTLEGNPVRYVIELPARLVGVPERPGHGDTVRVTVWVGTDGLPTKTLIEAGTTTGLLFSGWGEAVSIAAPSGR